MFKNFTFIYLFFLSGCLGLGDAEIEMEFEKKKDPFKEVKERIAREKEKPIIDIFVRDVVNPIITMVSPQNSPASSSEILLKIENGLKDGDTLGVFSDDTCKTEITDYRQTITSADPIEVTISNIPLGFFQAYFQVTDGDEYISGCVPFSYELVRSEVQLLGEFPATGGRSTMIQVTNLTEGDEVKIFANLGSYCDVPLGGGVVTSDEAELNNKEVILSFPDRSDWDKDKSGPYEIYSKTIYQDQTDSGCSESAIATYDLDLTPPDPPETLTIETATPNNTIANPIVSATTDSSEVVKTSVYINDETCSIDSALYQTGSTDTGSIFYNGEKITEDGSYEFFITSADEWGNKTDCLSMGTFIYDTQEPRAPEISLERELTHSNAGISFDFALGGYKLGDTIGLYTDSGCTTLLEENDGTTPSVDEATVRTISDGGVHFINSDSYGNDISFAPTLTNNESLNFYVGLKDLAGNVNCIQDLYSYTFKQNDPSFTFPSGRISNNKPVITLQENQFIDGDKLTVFTDACVTELNNFTINNSDPSLYLADLSARADGSYTLYGQMTYQDSTTGGCISLGTYELDTVADPPVLTLENNTYGTDLSPNYSISGIEGGAVWLFYEGICPTTFDIENISEVGLVNGGGSGDSDLSGILDHLGPGSYTYHVIQIDSAGNFQKGNGDLQCTQQTITINSPATLSGAFSNPTNFLAAENGDNTVGAIANNVVYPTFTVSNIESGATVKLYATTSGDSMCEGIEVYNDLPGAGAQEITITSPLSVEGVQNLETTFSMKQVASVENGEQESECVEVGQKYMFDTGILPESPSVALNADYRNPSSSSDFKIDITPKFVGDASQFTLYIYDTDPGFVPGATDGDFTGAAPLDTLTGLTSEQSVTSTLLSISPAALTNNDQSQKFHVYLKKTNANFGKSVFTYKQDLKAPTEIKFSPEVAGNDSSPKIAITGLIIGEDYEIYPVSGCGSGVPQSFTADALTMSFDLSADFLGVDQDGVDKTICIQSTSFTSDPVDSSNIYNLDNKDPAQLTSLAITSGQSLGGTSWTGKVSDGLPNFSFSDHESGAAVYLYGKANCQDDPIGVANPTAGISTITITNSEFQLSEGANEFSVAQNDGLNDSICSSSVSYLYDTSPPVGPTLAISSFGPSSLHTYSVDVTDIETNASLLIFYNNTCSGTPSEIRAYGTGSETINRTLNILTTITTTTDSVSVKARDEAMNMSDCVSKDDSENNITYTYSHVSPIAEMKTADGPSSAINVDVTGLLDGDKVNIFGEAGCSSSPGAEQTIANGATATVPLTLGTVSGTNSTHDIYVQATYQDTETSDCLLVGTYQFDDAVDKPTISHYVPAAGVGSDSVPQFKIGNLELDRNDSDSNAPMAYLFRGTCTNDNSIAGAISEGVIGSSSANFYLQSSSLLTSEGAPISGGVDNSGNTDYTFYVKTKDEFGNFSVCSDPITYTLDITTSALALSFDGGSGKGPGQSPGYSGTPDLLISGSIEGTVYLFKTFCPAVGIEGAIGSSSTSSIKPDSAFALVDGTYDLFIKQVESGTGNESDCSPALAYVYDSQIVTPNITTPASGVFSDSASNTINIAIDNFEANGKLYLLSSCESVTDLNNGESLDNQLANSSSGSISYTVPPSDESVTKEYHLRQVDQAGNVSDCVSFSYEFDETINKPNFGFDNTVHPSATPGPEYTLLTSNVHKVYPSLTGDNDTETKYYLGGSCSNGTVTNSTELTTLGTDVNGDFINLEANICSEGTSSADCADGDYVIFVHQVDNAGNSICSDPITYTYDDTLSAPVLSFGEDNPSPVKSVSDVDFTLDTDSDIATKTLYLGGTCTSGISDGTSLGDSFVALNLVTPTNYFCASSTSRTDPSCTNTFHAVVVDNAGNKKCSNTISLLYDSVAPVSTVQLVSPAANNATNLTFTISNSTNDSAATAKLFYSTSAVNCETEFGAVQTGVAVDLTEILDNENNSGTTYNFYVQETDAAGNVGVCSASADYVFDNKATTPSIVLAAARDNVTEIDITMSNYENKDFYLYLDSCPSDPADEGTPLLSGTADSDGIFTYDFSFSNDTLHTVYMKQKDSEGNLSDCGSATYFYDKTAPAIEGLSSDFALQTAGGVLGSDTENTFSANISTYSATDVESAYAGFTLNDTIGLYSDSNCTSLFANTVSATVSGVASIDFTASMDGNGEKSFYVCTEDVYGNRQVTGPYVYNLQQNNPSYTLPAGKQSNKRPSISLGSSTFVNGDTVSIFQDSCDTSTTGTLINTFFVNSADSSGYIADLSDDLDSYNLFMQIKYEDNTLSSCVDIGSYYLDTVADAPILTINTLGNKDFTPAYEVSGIESDSTWNLYAGACADTSFVNDSNLGTPLISGNASTNLVGNLTINSAGTHKYHVIQIDGAGNYQRSNGSIQCAERDAIVALPATLSASFLNPASFLEKSAGESYSEDVAGNVMFPTLSVGNIEEGATVEIYGATSATTSVACDPSTVIYSGVPGSGTQNITTTTTLNGPDYVNKVTTFYFKQIANGDLGAKESVCHELTQKYMFDSGILPPAPGLAVGNGEFNPSHSQEFTLNITPSVIDSGYTIYIYDTNPGFDSSNSDGDFDTSDIEKFEGVDNTSATLTSQTITLGTAATAGADSSHTYYVYIKKTGGAFGLATFTYTQSVKTPTISFTNSSGKDSSPEITVGNLVYGTDNAQATVGENYTIYDNASCSSNSKDHTFQADPSNLTFDLPDEFLGTSDGTVDKTICIKSASTSTATASYTLDNTSPAKPGLTLSAAQGANSNGLPTFTVDSYEAGATIKLYHSADCGSNEIFSGITGSVSQSDITTFLNENNISNILNEGVNHFSVKQIDTFTNESSCSATGVSDSAQYTYDTTPPSILALEISVDDLDGYDSNTKTARTQIPVFDITSGLEFASNVYLVSSTINSCPSIDTETDTVTDNKVSGDSHSEAQIKYYFAYQKDDVGNVSACSNGIEYTYDGIAAKLTNVAIESAVGLNTTPTITFDGFEEKGDASTDTTVTVYSCTTSDTSTATCSPVGTSTSSGSITTNTLVVDGAYHFALKQVDPYGNESAYSSVVSYTLDTGAPSDPTLSISPTNDNSSTPVAPTISASNIGAGESLIIYSDINCSAEIGTASSSSSVLMPGPSPNSTTTYYAKILDSAGNYSEGCDSSISYLHDNTNPTSKPVLSLTSPDVSSFAGTVESGTGIIYSNVGTISLSSSHTTEGNKSSTYLIEGAGSCNDNIAPLNTIETIYDDTVDTVSISDVVIDSAPSVADFQKTKTYTYYLQEKDEAGNYGPCSDPIVYRYDNYIRDYSDVNSHGDTWLTDSTGADIYPTSSASTGNYHFINSPNVYMQFHVNSTHNNEKEDTKSFQGFFRVAEFNDLECGDQDSDVITTLNVSENDFEPPGAGNNTTDGLAAFESVALSESNIWYMRASITDNAGNSSCSKARNFWYIKPSDKPAPVIAFTGDSLSNSPSIELNVTTSHNYSISYDGGSGFVYPITQTDILYDEVENTDTCSVDENEYVSALISGVDSSNRSGDYADSTSAFTQTIETITPDNLSFINGKSYCLIAKQTDRAGNIGYSAPIKYSYDVTPPAVAVLDGNPARGNDDDNKIDISFYAGEAVSATLYTDSTCSTPVTSTEEFENPISINTESSVTPGQFPGSFSGVGVDANTMNNFYIEIMDGAGNLSGTCVHYTYFEDEIAPLKPSSFWVAQMQNGTEHYLSTSDVNRSDGNSMEFGIIANSPDGSTYTNEIFLEEVGDSSSGSCHIDNRISASYSSGSTLDLTMDNDNLPQGNEYKIYARQIDAAGNVGACSDPITFIFDTYTTAIALTGTNPTTTNSSGVSTGGSSPTFTFSGYEPDASIYVYTSQGLCDDAAVDTEIFSAASNEVQPDLSGLGTGTRTLWFKQIDLTGFANPTCVSKEYIVDAGMLTADLTIVSGSDTYADVDSVESGKYFGKTKLFKIIENNSGETDVGYAWFMNTCGDIFSAPQEQQIALNTSFEITGMTSDNTYTICIRKQDFSGNSSDTTFTYRYDTTPPNKPTISFTEVVTAGFVRDDASTAGGNITTLDITASGYDNSDTDVDPESNNSMNVYVHAEGATNTGCHADNLKSITLSSATDLSTILNSASSDADGDNYLIYLEHRDQAGNTVCSDPITYTYDTKVNDPTIVFTATNSDTHKIGPGETADFTVDNLDPDYATVEFYVGTNSVAVDCDTSNNQTEPIDNGGVQLTTTLNSYDSATKVASVSHDFTGWSDNGTYYYALHVVDKYGNSGCSNPNKNAALTLNYDSSVAGSIGIDFDNHSNEDKSWVNGSVSQLNTDKEEVTVDLTISSPDTDPITSYTIHHGDGCADDSDVGFTFIPTLINESVPNNYRFTINLNTDPADSFGDFAAGTEETILLCVKGRDDVGNLLASNTITYVWDTLINSPSNLTYENDFKPFVYSGHNGDGKYNYSFTAGNNDIKTVKPYISLGGGDCDQIYWSKAVGDGPFTFLEGEISGKINPSLYAGDQESGDELKLQYYLNGSKGVKWINNDNYYTEPISFIEGDGLMNNFYLVVKIIDHAGNELCYRPAEYNQRFYNETDLTSAVESDWIIFNDGVKSYQSNIYTHQVNNLKIDFNEQVVDEFDVGGTAYKTNVIGNYHNKFYRHINNCAPGAGTEVLIDSSLAESFISEPFSLSDSDFNTSGATTIYFTRKNNVGLETSCSDALKYTITKRPLLTFVNNGRSETTIDDNSTSLVFQTTQSWNDESTQLYVSNQENFDCDADSDGDNGEAIGSSTTTITKSQIDGTTFIDKSTLYFKAKVIESDGKASCSSVAKLNYIHIPDSSLWEGDVAGAPAICSGIGYRYDTVDDECVPYSINQHIDNQMCAGEHFNCAIIDTTRIDTDGWGELSGDGTLVKTLDHKKHIFCWGQADNGQIGVDSGYSTSTYVAFDQTFTSKWVNLNDDEIPQKIFCGGNRACAITSGGVKCWGLLGSAHGQDMVKRIGKRSSNGDEFLKNLEPIVGTQFFKDVTLGLAHTCGLTYDNRAVCWGGNSFGKLGYTNEFLGGSLNGFDESQYEQVGSNATTNSVTRVMSSTFINDLAKGTFDSNKCNIPENNPYSCGLAGGTWIGDLVAIDQTGVCEITESSLCTARGGTYSTSCNLGSYQAVCEMDYDIIDIEASSISTCAIYQLKDNGEDRHIRCFGSGREGELGDFNSLGTYHCTNNSNGHDYDCTYRGTSRVYANKELTTISDDFNESTVDSLVAGNNHFCTYEKGSAQNSFCWGRGEQAQIGRDENQFNLADTRISDSFVDSNNCAKVGSSGVKVDGSGACTHDGDTTDDDTSLIYHDEAHVDLISISNFFNSTVSGYVVDEMKLSSDLSCLKLQKPNNSLDNDYYCSGNDTSYLLGDNNDGTIIVSQPINTFGLKDVNFSIGGNSKNFSDSIDFVMSKFGAYPWRGNRLARNKILTDFENTDGSINDYATIGHACAYFGDDSDNIPMIRCWGATDNGVLGGISMDHNGKAWHETQNSSDLDGTTDDGIFDTNIWIDDGNGNIDVDSDFTITREFNYRLFAYYDEAGDFQYGKTGVVQIPDIHFYNRKISEANGVEEIYPMEFHRSNIIGDNYAFSPIKNNLTYTTSAPHIVEQPIQMISSNHLLSPFKVDCSNTSTGVNDPITINISHNSIQYDIVLDNGNDEKVCGVWHNAKTLSAYINYKLSTNSSPAPFRLVYAKEVHKFGFVVSDNLNIYYGNHDGDGKLQDIATNILTKYLGFDKRGHQSSNVEWTFGVWNAWRYFNFAKGDCDNNTYALDPLGCVKNGATWTESRIAETPFGCVDTSKNYSTCTDSAYSDPAEYWGWQARPTSADATAGFCHRSFNGTTPLDNKAACDALTDHIWYGEAGANCFYASDNNICYDYLPLFK